MPETKRDDKELPVTKKPTDVAGHADAHLDDEEKIMAGHHDANYPALLTKDVPGG